MNYLLDVEELKNLIKPKTKGIGVTHDTGKITAVLPFVSSKKTNIIKYNFSQVLGEFTRLLSNVKLDVEKEGQDLETHFGENATLSKVTEVVMCENEDIRYDLHRFLDDFLYGNSNRIKPIHPYVYNYYPLSEKSKEEKKFAQFTKDVLIGEKDKLSYLFEKNEGEDILTSLILKKLNNLVDVEKPKSSYAPVLNVISERFKEDLIFISKYRDYFLEHYPLLVHYYFFLYVTQLTLKFDEFESADYAQVQPLYFGLEWESINKRRKAASEMEGYKRLKDKAKHLFVHIHTLSQLSHNTFNQNKMFMTYVDIYNTLNETSEEDQTTFLNSLNEWIKEYIERSKIEIPYVRSENVKEAFRMLFKCLKEGMSTPVVLKYGTSVEDTAVDKFLKVRGNLGYTLNLTQDFLLMITAVAVKNDRIPLKQLFEEFEKRGIALDRYSQKEVIELLDNLNILDKKSDSGDAQYVKPIL
ncbi:DNA phosphorothioation-dependent restriction protein DptG [Alkalihalobacillus deserti]|uniref:DNA phosphorothioation-dependent restriction protein DptG n=1 Tax=Alkalihalobacillus deserti TaxID=2879466 RepID=UPI001D14C224|nr:DNA phosphorothioation-dependent restriction protein DptG [Alkalihalobacillus deserti]